MAISGSFVFDVVKPDGEVLSEHIDECVIPGDAGSFGVLRGHAPFIAQVGAGEVMYRVGRERRYLAVEGGFCEVRPHRVTLLAEHAERPDQIDVARATRARELATGRLKTALADGATEEAERTRRKLRRAELRLEVSARRAGVKKS